ncbi:MAG: hypothetical protein ABH872_01665 [Candidatus Omnitrophota bacterium]
MRFITIFLIAVLFLTSGCYNIRKKFIRKRKPRTDFSVYLDLKDYPQGMSLEAYEEVYFIIKAWLDECINSLEGGNNFKREKKSLEEALFLFEQMISFFTDSGKVAVNGLKIELVSIIQDYSRRPNMTETGRYKLINRLIIFKREFESKLRPSKGYLWVEDSSL